MPPAEKEPVEHFEFTPTGLPWAIVVPSAEMDGQPLEAGDEIAVYDGAECVGAAVWRADQATVLTAWRGDERAGLSGYRRGHEMRFKARSKRFNCTYDMQSPAAGESRCFETGAYAVVTLSGKPGLLPGQFALHNAFPNPFNASTTIRFDIARETLVTLVIYDLRGNEVNRLVDHRVYRPGCYQISWNGVNRFGASLSSGVYFIRIQADDFNAVRKCVLMK